MLIFFSFEHLLTNFRELLYPLFTIAYLVLDKLHGRGVEFFSDNTQFISELLEFFLVSPDPIIKPG